MWRRHGEVELEVLVKRHLDEAVDAGRRCRTDLLDGVRLAVVHDRVGAGGLRQRSLLRAADRRDHVSGVLEARELDRRMADGARAA